MRNNNQLGNQIRRMFFGPLCFIFCCYVGSVLNSCVNIFTLAGFYLFIYFSLFTLIDISVSNVASFHEGNNRTGNIKQPVKYFLENKNDIKWSYKTLFNTGFLIITYLVWEHKGLIG